MDLYGRHFLKLLDYSSEEIEYLLDLAADLKEKKAKRAPRLRKEGKDKGETSGKGGKSQPKRALQGDSEVAFFKARRPRRNGKNGRRKRRPPDSNR